MKPVFETQKTKETTEVEFRTKAIKDKTSIENLPWAFVWAVRNYQKIQLGAFKHRIKLFVACSFAAVLII